MGLTESTVGRWSGPSKSRSVSQFSDSGCDDRTRQCATLPNRSFGGKPASPTTMRHHHARGARDSSLGATAPSRDHTSGEFAREGRRVDDRGRPVTRGRRTHSAGREVHGRSRSANRALQLSPQDCKVISPAQGAIQPQSIYSPERSSPSKRKGRSHNKSRHSSKSRHRSCARDTSGTDTTFPSHHDSPNSRRKKLNRRSDPLMDAKARSGNEPAACGKDTPLYAVAQPTEMPVYRDCAKSRPRPSAIYVPHDDPLQAVIDIASANEQVNAPSPRCCSRNISEETSKHISTLTLSASNLRDRNQIGHCPSVKDNIGEVPVNHCNRASRFLRHNSKAKTESDLSECFDHCKLFDAECPSVNKHKPLTLRSSCYMNSASDFQNPSVNNIVSRGNFHFPERSEVCIQLTNLYCSNNNEYKLTSNPGAVEVQPNVWFESRPAPDDGTRGDHRVSNSYHVSGPRSQAHPYCDSSVNRFPRLSSCEMDGLRSHLGDFQGNRRTSPIDYIDPGPECYSVDPACENTWSDVHVDARICDGRLRYYDSTQVDYSHIPFIFNDGPLPLRDDPHRCDQFYSQGVLSPIHSYVPSSSFAVLDSDVETVLRDTHCRNDPHYLTRHPTNRESLPDASRLHDDKSTVTQPESSDVCGSMRFSCNRESLFCQESCGRMLISDVNSDDRCSVTDRANSNVGGLQQTIDNLVPFCPPPPLRPPPPVRTDTRQNSGSATVLAADAVRKCFETVKCDQCSALNSDHLQLSSCHSLCSIDHNSLSVSEPDEFSEESIDFAEEYSPVMAELRLPLLENQPRLVDILNISSPSLDEVESIVSDVCKEPENELHERSDTLLGDDASLTIQTDSSMLHERSAVPVGKNKENLFEKSLSTSTSGTTECVEEPTVTQTLKNSTNISTPLSPLSDLGNNSSLPFEPEAGFCDQRPCLTLNTTSAVLYKPEVKRNSWSPWSALASSAATLRDRIHAAGGRKTKRGWLPKQGKTNSMVVLIEASPSTDLQQSSDILNCRIDEHECEPSSLDNVVSSVSEKSMNDVDELKRRQGSVQICTSVERRISRDSDDLRTTDLNDDEQKSVGETNLALDFTGESCVMEPLCSKQQELVNHGLSSELQRADASADCGYTCHEQCRPLVAIDCRARHTPEYDPTYTADRSTPPLPTAAHVPAQHLEAAPHGQLNEAPSISDARDDVQESKELKEKSNDLKSSGYHSKSSDQDFCPSDEDDDSSDYATLENDHPLTRGSLTIKDGLSTVELQQHLLHCSAERSSGHGSSTAAPEREKHEAEKQEKDLVNGTSFDSTSLRRAIEGLCEEGVPPAHLESWLLDTAAAQGLQLSREEDGSYRGCLRVHLNLCRPINIVAGTRPPSIYDILKEDRTLDKTLTSFYMPRNAVKAIHITSNTTTREVIVALLRKFKVVDNPQKFALYERSFDCHSNNGSLRRISDSECPLVLAMQWTAEGLTAHRVVLQENDTADIQWDAFSLPELNNFLRILDREEEDYRSQILDKYARIRSQIRERLAFQQ